MRRITTSTSTAANTSKVFVDTGAWYAVSVPEDSFYDIATKHYTELVRKHSLLITSDYVIDETLTRIRYDAGHAEATAFWKRLQPPISGGRIRILRVDESIWTRAIGVFERYDDQNFSFTDCTSFVIAQDEKVDEVFGFDHHFALFGFVVKPVP